MNIKQQKSFTPRKGIIKKIRITRADKVMGFIRDIVMGVASKAEGKNYAQRP